MLFKEALLDAASVGLFRRDGPAKVRIPVKVCLLVTIPVPFDGVLPKLNDFVKKNYKISHVQESHKPAIPIRAEVRLVTFETGIADEGVFAGVLIPRLGVIIGGGNAGLVNVSTFLETIPLFSVRILMIEDLLHPGVSSNAN